MGSAVRANAVRLIVQEHGINADRGWVVKRGGTVVFDARTKFGTSFKSVPPLPFRFCLNSLYALFLSLIFACSHSFYTSLVMTFKCLRCSYFTRLRMYSTRWNR